MDRHWASIGFCILLLFEGCGGGGTSGACGTAGDCEGSERCVEGRCVPSDESGDAGASDASMGDAGGDDAGGDDDAGAARCGDGRPRCGESCCGTEEVCGTDEVCCVVDALCGGRCCGAGEVCEGALCRLDCGGTTRCVAEDGSERCCGAGEVCAAGSCFLPTTSCRDFVDCPDGQYCDRELRTCLPRPGGEACEEMLRGGAVVPTLLWHWDGRGATMSAWNQVMMTPVVVQLTDDDGDGDVDQDDVPDVVFNTFQGTSYTRNGVMRAVSGADGSSIFDVTDSSLRVIPDAQIAAGDLDGDGLVELVTCASPAGGAMDRGELVAFEHDGTLKWRGPPEVSCGAAAPFIADLEGDGMPEVVVRYSVLDGVTGTLRWRRACRNIGGYAVGARHHVPCDYSTAADLDGDGHLEVVGGNVAYRFDGSEFYDRSEDFRDGYPAVADLDLDGVPEVVVVLSAFDGTTRLDGDHHVRALRADGSNLWGPVDINPAMPPPAFSARGNGGGGPPTVANLDDDPEPEIGLAGGAGYVVLEPDGAIKWFAPTLDNSSRKTGSSVFDFDGDGVAEIVYNDEYWLRVYEGSTGRVRYCQCNTSATHWEYPVVVDVNADGHAEIVVVSNDAFRGRCPIDQDLDECTMARIMAGETDGAHGVRVFASPERDWVATRRVWNQHTYHVTNVTESGAVPSPERANWRIEGLNNFRQNVQPRPRSLPDPKPEDLAVDVRGCPERMLFNFRLVNRGWAALPAGVEAVVSVDAGSGYVELARVTSSRRLLPGQFEAFEVPFLDPPAAGPVRFRVEVRSGGADETKDCRTENNVAETEGACFQLE